MEGAQVCPAFVLTNFLPLTQFRSKKDGSHFPVGGGSGVSASDFNALNAQDKKRFASLNSRNEAFRQSLKPEERDMNDRMGHAWETQDSRFKQLMMQYVWGNGYSANYHGALVDAKWLEIPPAVRYELIRLWSDMSRYHEFNQLWLAYVRSGKNDSGR